MQPNKGSTTTVLLLALALGAFGQNPSDRAKAHFVKKHPGFKFEELVEEGTLTIGFLDSTGSLGEAVYDEAGDWLYTSTVVKDVPANVKAGALRAYPGAKFTGYKKVQRQDGQMFNLYLSMPDGGAFDVFIDASGHEI